MSSSYCGRIHQALARWPRLHFPIADAAVPRDGIYIVFEEGEHAHGGDRVVRIGTHTGLGQLRSRLRQHFVQERKDRSIFRKNLGRALLARRADPFLSLWEIDLTTAAARQEHADRIDAPYQEQVEREVSEVVRERFSLVVLPVREKAERLWLESRLISTVSACPGCGPSPNWLGLHSPKEKIRRSGLWQVNELWKQSFEGEQMERFLARITPGSGSRSQSSTHDNGRPS